MGRAGALVCALLELLEPGQRLVQRARAQHHGDGIRLTLLVEQAEVVGETLLRRQHVPADDHGLTLDDTLFPPESVDTAAQDLQPAAGCRELRVERVEPEEGVVRSRGETGRAALQLACVLLRPRASGSGQ